jgi:rare lipoprotein A
MRSRLFIIWAAVRWLLLMFVVTQGLEAPAIARRSEATKPVRVWSGVASWYGPNFHGRLTANGESYDMYGLTAAHRTLPIGSLVRVVNPQTNARVVVRINDRGPFIKGREIDVSYEVARSLGFDRRGLARLRIELLETPDGPWQKPQAN